MRQNGVSSQCVKWHVLLMWGFLACVSCSDCLLPQFFFLSQYYWTVCLIYFKSTAKLLTSDRRLEGRENISATFNELFASFLHNDSWKYATALNCSMSIYSSARGVLCERQLGKINKHSKIKRPHPSFLLSLCSLSFFSAPLPFYGWVTDWKDAEITYSLSPKRTQSKGGKMKGEIFSSGGGGGGFAEVCFRDGKVVGLFSI